MRRASSRISPFLRLGSALIARPPAFHAENFRVTTRDRVSSPETGGSSSKMNPLCDDLA